MGRLESFRHIRKTRRKVKFVMLLFVLIIVSGICLVDYSFNEILKNESTIGIINLQNLDKSRMEVKVMNQDIILDTSGINKDIKRIQEFFQNLYNGK